MKSVHSLYRINELMALFANQVKGATALSLIDINRVAETVLIPLFKEVYGYKDLKNLNITEAANFPGVDLGDATARVAIQVTATRNSEKIKETLRKYVRHELYHKFDRVFVYILTEKQATYSGQGFDEIIGDRFKFDKERDILDYRNILAEIGAMQIDQLQRIESILEANFGNGSALALGEVEKAKTEKIYLNLLEILFPDTLYVADLSDDLRKSARSFEGVGQGGRPFRPGPWKPPPGPRDRVLEFLHAHDLKFAVDWEYYAGQIVTFHDLEDERLPLSRAVERGTVTPLQPEEFYSQGDAEENAFRSLLRRCLQQKLYPRAVRWQHEVKMFIFCPEDGEELREEEWVGKKKNPGREVYRLIKKDPAKMKKRQSDEDEVNLVLHHKHLAFETQHLRIGDKWYLLIKPDWYFSFDGYRPSLYGMQNVSWIKRKEGNQKVYDYLRFLVYFLKNDKQSTLFHQIRPYQFLSFGAMLSLDGAPELDDQDWLPGERKGKRKRLIDADTEALPLPAETVTSPLFSGAEEADDEDEEDK